MLKLNRILVLLFLLNLSSSIAQNDKVSFFEKLKSEYSNITSVHLIFGMNEADNKSAELYAEKGGKMRLSLKGNIIISDGETIWNVNPGYSATVSNYEDTKDMTLELIFFGLMNELEPITYTSLKNTSSSEKYSLKLKPKNNSDYKQQLKYITLNFDKSNNLKRVIVDSPNGIIDYSIRFLEKGIKIDPNKFRYTPTDDIEVIDFR